MVRAAEALCPGPRTTCLPRLRPRHRSYPRNDPPQRQHLLRVVDAAAVHPARHDRPVPALPPPQGAHMQTQRPHDRSLLLSEVHRICSVRRDYDEYATMLEPVRSESRWRKR